MDSGSPATTPQRTLVMNHTPITRTIPSRQSDGWLTDLLRRRIMSLQAYPRLASMQGWEGRVVVRATIKNDGSLLDAVVIKSSGYAALDDDALKLLHRVCPIRLQHELSQLHVEVEVPIDYRLER
jgi:periplasmic protein TonB